MQVLVRLQGKAIPVNLPAQATAADLQEALELGPTGLRFLLNGRVLDSEMVLADALLLDAFVPADGAGKDKKRKKKAHKTPKKIKHKDRKVRLECLSFYTVKGDTIDSARPYCPNCGPGVRIAQHKNRGHCGRCGYAPK
ncbi:Ribosomal protein S27a [Giardia muris]|uniref:Ribosomal protein S27a n=1 Tax=Giardia muris TaxID=5742 RepID=A0A4Z1SPY2_GIAMU|nr:Ribosomal protein S27a [Giardia muris]|eukprot:TNJ27894.1 Ribosomal protein S27a [Giardia muris]